MGFGGSAAESAIGPSTVRRQHSAATHLEVRVLTVVCDGGGGHVGDGGLVEETKICGEVDFLLYAHKT